MKHFDDLKVGMIYTSPADNNNDRTIDPKPIPFTQFLTEAGVSVSTPFRHHLQQIPQALC